MEVNSTFNNISVISWRSVLLVEETGVPTENHRHIASHWQTLPQYIEYTSPWPRFELTTLLVRCTDCICNCKSNYHTITAMSAPTLSETTFSRNAILHNVLCNVMLVNPCMLSSNKIVSTSIILFRKTRLLLRQHFL